MNVIRKLVRSDREGAIHLDLNLIPDRSYEVVLIYQPSPVEAMPPMSPTEWAEFVEATAGSSDAETFRRHDRC